MRRSFRRAAAGWLLSLTSTLPVLTPALLAGSAQAQTAGASLATNAPAGQPLSTRVVAYEIDAKIDTGAKTVDATEVLTYRNLTDQPLQTFPFHLYLNAFQPQSTFTTETHFGGGIRDSEAEDGYPAKKLGSITIAHLEADGFGDLTGAMHFESPDDGNPNDRTVAEVRLPHAVAPGESITFRMRFHDVFPESVARNGYKRDFLMGGQWFPKVGVFWHGAWNCHQYHATTEFFSDFGTYNVRLTLPREYTVGASGVPTGDHTNGDGTRTLSFYGEDIIDFAWAASPHFTVTTGTYLSSMGPVEVRVLALAAHPGAGARYLKILLGSLDQFDRRYGPYPYKILTLIDPEPGSEIGGMEYPTLITGDASLLDPTHLQEITAEHEFGHQYWYAMVATNEFEDAWLDEGINSFTESEVTEALLGRDTSAFQAPWANLSDLSLHYLEYTSDPIYDPVTRHAWQFRNALSYGSITYGKSGMLLRTLEGIVGKDAMDAAMRTYFMRYRFTHPTTLDFLRTIQEVADSRGREAPANPEALLPASEGPVTIDCQTLSANAEQSPSAANQALLTFERDCPAARTASLYSPSPIQSYFQQAVYGTEVLDYAVDSIRSGPAEWWKATPDAKTFRDTVTVHRIGSFLLPVTVQVIFSDGTRVRERWDPSTEANGNDRWHSWTYVGSHGRIVSAEVDPDHLLLLDVDRFNDSRTVKANHVPALKLTNVWVTLTQLGSQLMGWLV
jgi:hypothetical protein